ncbi:hypothetical protein, partial [Citrobacter freundii]
SVVFNRSHNSMPETAEVKNADQARAFINDYIARNINETPMHLVLTKEGRAFGGFDALNSSLPPAIESSTRL